LNSQDNKAHAQCLIYANNANTVSVTFNSNGPPRRKVDTSASPRVSLEVIINARYVTPIAGRMAFLWEEETPLRATSPRRNVRHDFRPNPSLSQPGHPLDEIQNQLPTIDSTRIRTAHHHPSSSATQDSQPFRSTGGYVYLRQRRTPTCSEWGVSAP
jgi:hypothetical protein